MDSKAQKFLKAFTNCVPGVHSIELMAQPNRSQFLLFLNRYRHYRRCWWFINVSNSCKFRSALGGVGGKSWVELVHRWAGELANPLDPPKHPQGIQSQTLWLLAIRCLQCSSISAIQHRRKHCNHLRHALQLTQINESHEARLEVKWRVNKTWPRWSFYARYLFAHAHNLIFVLFARSESTWKSIGNCWRSWLEVE